MKKQWFVYNTTAQKLTSKVFESLEAARGWANSILGSSPSAKLLILESVEARTTVPAPVVSEPCVEYSITPTVRFE